MRRSFDLIVYGASGFTGQRVVENLLSSVLKEKPHLKLAVAGRNEAKVKQSLKAAAMSAGMPIEPILDSVSIVTASNDHVDSLCKMSLQTKLLINCVGPFRYYGEPVVRACLDTKTHYIDITGEPEFQERMQLKYHKEAEESNVYIVPASGFDCIPCDLGVKFLSTQSNRQFDGINIFIHGQSDLTFNDATWVSFIEGISNFHSLLDTRKKLYRQTLREGYLAMKNHRNSANQPTSRRRKNFFHHKDSHGSGYAIVFSGADHSVLKRTQMHDHIIHGIENFPEIRVYQVMKPLSALSWLGFLSAIKILGTTDKRREILKRYPSLFSAGIFSPHGPSEDELRRGRFDIIIQGELDGKVMHEAKVSGPHPGYIGCSICTNQAALTVLEESDKMPSTGGVFTPGTAFSQTSLIHRLNQHGVAFTLNY